MAAKKKVQAPAQAAQVESRYPSIEQFAETASAADVTALFEPIKAGLGALKGPRAEHGKKVGKAIARTEELLSYLLQVRERIEAERKGGGAGR
jgi:hypothetical protein